VSCLAFFVSFHRSSLALYRLAVEVKKGLQRRSMVMCRSVATAEVSERLSLESVELEKVRFLTHPLSLQVDGSEDYEIPV